MDVRVLRPRHADWDAMQMMTAKQHLRMPPIPQAVAIMRNVMAKEIVPVNTVVQHPITVICVAPIRPQGVQTAKHVTPQELPVTVQAEKC